ncbi:MAG: sulfotransferase [Limisphaerales bacterium]
MKHTLKASTRSAFRVAFAVTERVLALGLEKPALRTSLDRPIIIVGPERSGTSFIYALLATHANVYALTTIADRFPDYPFSATLLRRILSAHENQLYRSVPKTVGEIDGGLFPLTEGVRYWLQHLGTQQGRWKNAPDDCLTEQDLDENTRLTLPNDLKKRAFIMRKKRLLLKQPGFSLKIRYFNAVFPDAIFVHCLRNPASNFLSLLAQKKRTGNPDWGIQIPASMKLPGASVEAKTARQLAVTYDLIRQSINRINNGMARYVPVHYDSFQTDFAQVAMKLYQRCHLSAPAAVLNRPELFVSSSYGNPSPEQVTTDPQAVQILEDLCRQMKNDFPEDSFRPRVAAALLNTNGSR